MNPLLLLLGLLGFGASSFAASRGSWGNAAASAEEETVDTSDDNEPEGMDVTFPAPETSGEQDPVTNGGTPDTTETPSTGSTDNTGSSSGTAQDPSTGTTDSTNTGSGTTQEPTGTSGGTGTTTGGTTGTGTSTGGTTSTGSGGTTSTGGTTGTTTGTSGGTTTIPTAPQQNGSSSGDGGDAPNLAAQGNVDVMAGRVATLSPPGSDVVGVNIVSGVQHGSLTVNPDNSFALVMTQSNFTGSQSFTYEATHTDGSISTHTVNLNVTPGLQAKGWATGETHYMLETDANDRVIVEHGENHVKVYVSSSSNALSRADIAQMEGISIGDVTGQWLANHGGYGQSEALALDEDAGMALWETVTPVDSETSNWLLLERGQDYNNLGRILESGAWGESELNPLYFGAWGTGTRPEVTTEFSQMQNSSTNLVVQDIHFSGGVLMLDSKNIIFDNVTVTEDGMVLQWSESITVRNSDFYDVYHEDPVNGTSWHPGIDRTTGIFAGAMDNLLLEGLFFDHNGWGPNYLSGEDQPPGTFSHNLYVTEDVSDVTFRDSISMRASSIGAMIRPGGFIEDNVLIDNQLSLVFLGGDHATQGPIGHYTLATDNLITSGAHKVVQNIGALTMGVVDRGVLTSMVDNIITHLADPNNPQEQASKGVTDPALTVEDTPYYDDTIIYNWLGSDQIYGGTVTEQNVGSLDTAVLDQTTIQLFTAQLTGNPNATIADLANYLRAQANGALNEVVDSDLILRFFQEGFGIAPDARVTADTLRFIPDDLGDGVRWDNRMNWDTDDLPGLFAADNVDLGGNQVVFGLNTEINELGFGAGGGLNVYGGRLDATGGMTGNGSLNVEGAGQAWIDGSNGSDIDITVQGGRFANTGDMSGTDLTATGGQTILAIGGAEYEVSASKTLAILEAAAQVGFDGDDGGMAILDMQAGSTLAYAADDGGLGTIEEFRSGAFGNAPDVLSGIDLGSSTLSIDLSGLAGGSSSFTLMDADEIVGVFSNALVDGLGARNANIVIDYVNDTVTLQLSAGNGSINVDTVGAENDVSSGEQALWDALTGGQGVASDTASAMPDDDDVMGVAA